MSPEYKAAAEELNQAERDRRNARDLLQSAERRVALATDKVTRLYAEWLNSSEAPSSAQTQK